MSYKSKVKKYLVQTHNMPALFPSEKLPACRGGGTKRKDKESAKGFKKGYLGGPGKTPTSAQCE